MIESGADDTPIKNANTDDTSEPYVEWRDLDNPQVIFLPEEVVVGIPLQLYSMTIDQVILAERYTRVTKARIHDKDVVAITSFVPSRYCTTIDMMIEPLNKKKSKFNDALTNGEKVTAANKLNIMSAILTHGTSKIQQMFNNQISQLKKIRRQIFQSDAPLHNRIWGRHTHIFKYEYDADADEDEEKQPVAKLPINIYVNSDRVASPLSDMSKLLAMSRSELAAVAVGASILSWEGLPPSAKPMFEPDVVLIEDRVKEMLRKCKPYL